MKQFSQPDAVTWSVAIVVTCLVLFVFQKIIWLLVPGLLALMLYYCIRPVVERSVRRGLSQNAAVNLVMGMFFLITLVVVVRAGLGIVAQARIGNRVPHTPSRGVNLMRHTIASLEERSRRCSGYLGAPLERPIDESARDFAMKHLGPIAIGLLEWTPSLLLLHLTYFAKDGNGEEIFGARCPERLL
jgi:predicted PurR-regulated permease PerM